MLKQQIEEKRLKKEKVSSALRVLGDGVRIAGLTVQPSPRDFRSTARCVCGTDIPLTPYFLPRSNVSKRKSSAANCRSSWPSRKAEVVLLLVVVPSTPTLPCAPHWVRIRTEASLRLITMSLPTVVAVLVVGAKSRR